MIVIDHPRSTPRGSYDRAVNAVINRLEKSTPLVSVYRIGQINDPGISDIDLVAVFEDGEACPLDLRKNMDRTARYLFCHSLFGTCRSLFVQARCFTVLRGFEHLWGEELRGGEFGQPIEPSSELKRQVALEYLLKFLISARIQAGLRIVKLRSFLLEAFALRHDLALLEVSPEPLAEYIEEVGRVRRGWFSRRHPEGEAVGLFDRIWHEVQALLKEQLRGGIALPSTRGVHLSKSAAISAGEEFEWREVSVNWPAFPARAIGRRYFNLTARMMKIDVLVPVAVPPAGSILDQRFSYERRVRSYNFRNLPHFTPLVSVIPFYARSECRPHFGLS